MGRHGSKRHKGNQNREQGSKWAKDTASEPEPEPEPEPRVTVNDLVAVFSATLRCRQPHILHTLIVAKVRDTLPGSVLAPHFVAHLLAQLVNELEGSIKLRMQEIEEGRQRGGNVWHLVLTTFQKWNKQVHREQTGSLDTHRYVFLDTVKHRLPPDLKHTDTYSLTDISEIQLSDGISIHELYEHKVLRCFLKGHTGRGPPPFYHKQARGSVAARLCWLVRTYRNLQNLMPHVVALLSFFLPGDPLEPTSTQFKPSAFLFNPVFWSLFTGTDPVLCIQGSTIRLSRMYVTLLESEARSGSVREKYQDGDNLSYLSQLRIVQIPRSQESQGSQEYVDSFEDPQTGEVCVYNPATLKPCYAYDDE